MEPRRDMFSLFEERIDRLETTLTKRIRKIEKAVKNLGNYVNTAIGIQAHDSAILSTLQDLFGYEQGQVKSFNSIMDDFQEKLKFERALPKGYKPYSLNNEYITSYILFLSKKWMISFNVIASYLVNNLGKKVAKKSVRKEDILAHYGENAVSAWKSILEE